MSYLLTPGRAGTAPLATDAAGQPIESVWYTTYGDYSFYDERATALRGRFANVNRVLVAGCGFGYFVPHLRSLGYAEAMGTDLSQFAIDQSKLRQAAIPAAFALGDCRSATSMTAVRNGFWAPNRPPQMVVTEDLLTAQETDAEVTSCIAALRPLLGAGGVLVHIVTCALPENVGMRAFDSNWKTFAEWQAFAPADVWVQANSSPLVVMRNGLVI